MIITVSVDVFAVNSEQNRRDGTECRNPVPKVKSKKET